MLHAVVLTQYWRVTDRRTELPVGSTALAMRALHCSTCNAARCNYYYYYYYYNYYYYNYYYYYYYYYYYICLTAFFQDNLGNRHQKGTPFWILLEQEMIGWQWHQLDHMQIICTSL